MSVNLNQAHAQLDDMGWALHPAMNDFDRQSLRILRCTAHAMMAGNPGGLRFKAGGWPWPGGVSASQLALAAQAAGRGGSPFLLSADH